MKKEWDCEEEDDGVGVGDVCTMNWGICMFGWLAGSRTLLFWHYTNTGWIHVHKCGTRGASRGEWGEETCTILRVEGWVLSSFQPARPCDEQMTGVQRLGQCEKR
jgi:hypothetical protein